MPDGQAGEVVSRGPNVMRGYLGQPEETAQTLRDGWLHTGDVGHFDEDGYLALVDRVKDMIIRGGENIYPKEIENVLYTHPAVLEAAVVGRPHASSARSRWPSSRCAPAADVTADELLEHCRSALARYKVPRAVFIDEALPKNAVGKISKPDLRARLRAASATSATTDGGAAERSGRPETVPQPGR